MSETVTIRDVAGSENCLVFATYGQTMGYVQALEVTLKQIICLYNYLEKTAVQPVDDEAMDRIFSEHDHSTLGRILKALEGRMDQVEERVKNAALQQLGLLRQARNSLAHRYLITKQGFMKTAQGRELVIADLGHYLKNFKIAADLFHELLSHLLDRLIGSSALRLELTRMWGEALDVAAEGVGLEHYRSKLQAAGAI